MATRTSLFDVQSLRDAAQNWNFDWFLPTIPGSSDTRDLTIKCQSTDMPGRTIEEVDIALHGVNLKQAARLTFTHTQAATFLETVDWETRNKFLRWSEATQSWKNNSGSVSAVYKVQGAVAVYDMAPTLTKQCFLYGQWLREMQDVPLDGSASAVVMVTANFSFDFWDDQ